jgi:hypothetical protein
MDAWLLLVELRRGTALVAVRFSAAPSEKPETA